MQIHNFFPAQTAGVRNLFFCLKPSGNSSGDFEDSISLALVLPYLDQHDFRKIMCIIKWPEELELRLPKWVSQS